jgi:hypothetical protein
MAKDKGQSSAKQPIEKGYQPTGRGYQPPKDVNAGYKPSETRPAGNPPTVEDTIDQGDNNDRK